jgi:hypothetical protein
MNYPSDLLSDLVNTDPVTEDGSALEIFFADGQVDDTDGLIWKDILYENQWAYRPGPGQKPVPVPLKIVAGHTDEAGEIGMADLLDAFDDQAIDHVTIPTSHEDRPDENTGYVRQLRIVERDGKKVLRAGMEFTEPDIRDKVERRSIANCSSGIIFGYVKKDTGKKYKQVLGHVALTNKPWLNGMAPFGMSEQQVDDEDITPVMLASVVWNQHRSFSWLRNEVERALNPNLGSETAEPANYYVADVAQNKALVRDFQTDRTYIVPFKVADESVTVAESENWITASQEWVKASEELFKTFGQQLSEEEAPKSGANTGDPDKGGNMSGKNEPENTPGAPSNDPAPDQTVLSDEQINELREQFRTELSESSTELSEENKALRAKVRALSVDKRIDELKAMGFNEAPGLLGEVRNLMLADDGQAQLTLSEDKDGTTKEVALSATDIVERIINVLPKKDEKLYFAELLESDAGEKPPATPDKTDLSDEEKADRLAEELGKPELVRGKKEGDE